MIDFNGIVCPIDFSDTSLRALKYATALANWYEAQLEVLHVVPAFEYEITDPVVAAGDLGPVLNAPDREGVLAQIRCAIKIAGATDTNHRALTVEGRVHEMILNRAAALPADVRLIAGMLFVQLVARRVARARTEQTVKRPVAVSASPPPSVGPPAPREVALAAALPSMMPLTVVPERRTRRLNLTDARSGIVVATILGPCRAQSFD